MPDRPANPTDTPPATTTEPRGGADSAGMSAWPSVSGLSGMSMAGLWTSAGPMTLVTGARAPAPERAAAADAGLHLFTTEGRWVAGLPAERIIRLVTHDGLEPFRPGAAHPAAKPAADASGSWEFGLPSETGGAKSVPLDPDDGPGGASWQTGPMPTWNLGRLLGDEPSTGPWVVFRPPSSCGLPAAALRVGECLAVLRVEPERTTPVPEEMSGRRPGAIASIYVAPSGEAVAGAGRIGTGALAARGAALPGQARRIAGRVCLLLDWARVLVPQDWADARGRLMRWAALGVQE